MGTSFNIGNTSTTPGCDGADDMVTACDLALLGCCSLTTAARDAWFTVTSDETLGPGGGSIASCFKPFFFPLIILNILIIYSTTREVD
ncbi:hypothetical protein Hanom_Chr09g00795481 [Helianthus anomalus]